MHSRFYIHFHPFCAFYSHLNILSNHVSELKRALHMGDELMYFPVTLVHNSCGDLSVYICN